MISCHHILDQIIGKDHEPYAQRLRLGWTIIGEACLGLVHTSDVITVNKTSVLPNQEITLKPCEYNFKVKDTKLEQKSEYSDIFEQTVEDNEVGLSREDKEFITIMENGVRKESNGNFSAPLPFRKDGTTLSNNYEQARKRAENLGRSFVAPVILGGRLIMRQALQNASVEWDDPLPEYLMNDWQVWKQSLKDLETLEIRRSFTETSLGDCSKYSTLFEVIEPEVDKEVRPLVEVKKTFVKSSGVDISLFEHFSTWTSLVRGIAFLKRKASMWHKDETDEKNSKSCVTFMKESEKLIIKEVQQDTYYNEIDCLKQSKPLQKNSSLIALSPVLDSDGLLREKMLGTDSFNIFLNKEKHKLVHIYETSQCCECTIEKISGEKLITKKQLLMLFKSDDMNLIREHRKYAGNKLIQICICKYSAKANIDVRVVDITLANYIIQKCGKHELGIDNWIEQIKDVRNEIFHLSDTKEMTDHIFSNKWTKLEGSIMGIAQVISSECAIEKEKTILQTKKLTIVSDYMLKYEIICRDYWRNKCAEFERAQNQEIEEKAAALHHTMPHRFSRSMEEECQKTGKK
ncbi:unnamed protein product [Mytilus edulis]|uniref:Uncharacterized protein n=1 Tax=Mytilus edulis TaxID=6550 RepID=A0A8S3UDV8_MYTED|nr:unnamed protein product [Mytilus edulis]